MTAAFGITEAPIERELARAQAEGLRANFGRWVRFAGRQSGHILELQVLDALSGRMRVAHVAHADSFPMALTLLERAERMECSGVYVIANQLDPAVASRAGCGQWVTALKGSSTTDRDVVARSVLFLDFDAQRPKGTSATSEQVAATADVAARVYERFSAVLGGAETLAYGHSGNGRSLFVALDSLENQAASPLIKAVLVAVKSKYETTGVEVDVSVSEPKRLVPCFGTVKRKGIAGSVDRPHRRTALACSSSVRRLDLAALEALVATLRDDCDERGRAEVDKALGLRHRASGVHSTGSPRTEPVDPAFDRAKAVPISDVLSWLGLLDGERPVCPGCGISDGSSVVIYGNGVKCSHARCAHLGFANGFRTTIDCVVEARNVTAAEAVTIMADQFGFEGFPPKKSAGRSTPHVPPPRTQGSPSSFVRGDHVELAKALRGELERDGEIVHTEGELFQYRAPSGVWATVDQALESRIVQTFAGCLIGEKPKPLAIRVSDVMGAIRLNHDHVFRKGFFDGGRPGLAFRNGFVEVSTEGVRLVAHSKEHRARTSYAFDYEPAASSRRFLSFIGELFAGDEDASEKASLLQEFFGACVLGIATSYQTAIVATGEGANGKSTLIEVVTGSMPPDTTAAIPPQDLQQEYRRALLCGKRLNVVSELPESDILQSEAFKAIVSGDLLTARHIHQAPFKFRPIAGHYFAANKLPSSSDLTEGFWRRLLVLPFRRSFRGADAKPNLGAELLAAERAGIVAWMLEGAVRVLRQGRYTQPPSAVAARDEWRRQASPVTIFLDECTRDVRDGEEGTRAAMLYESFRAWSDRNGHRSMSSTKFGLRMREVGKGAEKGRTANTYPVVLITTGGWK